MFEIKPEYTCVISNKFVILQRIKDINGSKYTKMG